MSNTYTNATAPIGLINMTPTDIIHNAHTRQLLKLMIFSRYDNNIIYKTIKIYELCIKIAFLINDMEETMEEIMRISTIAQRDAIGNTGNRNELSIINEQISKNLIDLRNECFMKIIASNEMVEFQDILFREFTLDNSNKRPQRK